MSSSSSSSSSTSVPESPLQTYDFHADLEFVPTYSTRDTYCKRLKTLRNYGVFRTNEVLASPHIVENLIKRDTATDYTISQDFKNIVNCLESLGPEKCGMDQVEHERIIGGLTQKRKELAASWDAHRDGDKPMRMTDDAWDELARKSREDYENIAPFYYTIPASERTTGLEDHMLEDLCLIKEVWHFNARSNWSTMKLGFHSNAQPIRDNLFFPTGNSPVANSPVAIWNHRKQDRMGLKGKKSTPGPAEWVDTEPMVQPFSPVPFPEMDVSTTDPVFVGRAWSLYLSQRHKRGHEFIVSDASGHPIARRKMLADKVTPYRDERGLEHWNFSRYTALIKRATERILGKGRGVGIADIRAMQSTRMARGLPPTALDARQWIAKNHHHSSEEERKYATHNLPV